MTWEKERIQTHGGERRLWGPLTPGADGQEKVLNAFSLLWQGTVGGLWAASWRVNWECDRGESSQSSQAPGDGSGVRRCLCWTHTWS